MDKRLFLQSLHSFLDKNSVNVRAPSQEFMHHRSPPQETTNNDVLATYLHSIDSYREHFSEEERRRRSKILL